MPSFVCCPLRTESDTTREQLSIDFVHRFFTIINFSWISIFWLIKFNHKYMHNHLGPYIPKYESRGKIIIFMKRKIL